MDVQTQSSTRTRKDLSTLARSPQLRELSSLTLPQIEAAVNLVAQMVPAGNIPRVILNGLMQLPGRRLSNEITKRDTNALFEALEKLYDTALYGAAFAGPAAVIWGYQTLLRLAGKEIETAFPNGVWQFYVDYALREDTAHHTYETVGFDAILHKYQIRLSLADRLTAWVLAASNILHQYNELLKNEWRERIYTHTLAQLTASRPDHTYYRNLYRDWEQQRPYGRGRDAKAHETYPVYRRNKFNQFLERAMRLLPTEIRLEWVEQVRLARGNNLPTYQRQMSILSYLSPGRYGEERVPIAFDWAYIGLILHGRYYLLPAATPGSSNPADPHTIRAQIAALVNQPATNPPVSLIPLARMRRQALADFLPKLSGSVSEEWAVLRLAPILINGDPRPPALPLSELRRGERGAGHQAITIFDTNQSHVFDLSHIFFDGTWGAALSEIITNEALSWAVFLSSLAPVRPAATRPVCLTFPFRPEQLLKIRQAPTISEEVSAETSGVNVNAIFSLRRLFKLRNDLIHLTVNDILVLYRALHAATYRPEPSLLAELQSLAKNGMTQRPAEEALKALQTEGSLNPAVLIPVDASQQEPGRRVHPMSFMVPIEELDLLQLHTQTNAALMAYREGEGDRHLAHAAFDRLQRRYLATLAGCGQVFRRAKEIAVQGETASVGSIKMLAYLPPALQRILDSVPNRFEVLNDVLKGREVFSNIGAVAPSSSLTRFMTAKDDNEHKTLAWGILTTADDRMVITLRDFRPHVIHLIEAGQRELAGRITQHYLDSYAEGLNQFVVALRQITMSSRETNLQANTQPAPPSGSQ